MNKIGLLVIIVLCFFITAAPVSRTLSKPLIPQSGALKLDYSAGTMLEQKQETVTSKNLSSSPDTSQAISVSLCSYCSNISTMGPNLFPVITPITNITQTDSQQRYKNHHHGYCYTSHEFPSYGHGEWLLAADGRYWWYPVPHIYNNFYLHAYKIHPKLK